jgi:hypothetical protein
LWKERYCSRNLQKYFIEVRSGLNDGSKFPQGLKPDTYKGLDGTAEAVP